jgi:dephospho-CoA kinase
MSIVIVGITGTIGAGKETIVNQLTVCSPHFRHFSVRAFLKREMEKAYQTGDWSTRDTMVATGNYLREKHGSGYIVEQLHQSAINCGENSIIESIRNVGEIELLRKKALENKDERFFLFAVDADRETRYKRIVDRKSETDFVSFEEFCKQENREMTSADPNKQNLSACIELADYRFTNDGTIQDLRL